MKLLKKAKSAFQKLTFLLKTDAPLWVMWSYLFLKISQGISGKSDEAGKNYVRKRDAFKASINNLHLDNDWFIGNIPLWLRSFDKAKLKQKQNLNCLEIGSWQGLSAYFTVSELTQATLTCVDTWEGADEHKSGAEATQNVLSKIEQAFDQNLSAFSSRLKKYKGISYSYFNDNFMPDSFDLIYVDGSHHSDDVIVDAIKCFEMLKVGGVMIFDDYFWQYYPKKIDNPAGAINAFLRMKRDQLEIIGFTWQLVIIKTAHSIR